MMRVAVLDDYQKVAEGLADWSPVKERASVDFFHEHLGDDDAVVAKLAEYDIVVAVRERTRFPKSVLERLPRLKLISNAGHYMAHIDLVTAHERGITVCETTRRPGPTGAVAELAWAHIFALARNLFAEDASVRAGGWQAGVGMQLGGRRLGVLGLGRSGEAVARIGLALEMDVVAWSQNLTEERCAEVGVHYVDKDTLFRTSDFITVQLVLSRRTRSLIGTRELGLMKKTAYLINTARGPIVDEKALLDALHAGTIAGAGLDVFDQEPLPADHPLRSAPRTVLTPHIGYVSDVSYETFYVQAVENICAFFDGKPIRVLNPDNTSKDGVSRS
jgi:phosphoglycerate dehydrogenase-like enzyme